MKTKKPITEEIPQSPIPFKKGDVGWIYTQEGAEQAEVLGAMVLVELQTMNGGGRWFSRLSSEIWETENLARREGASSASRTNDYYRDNSRLNDERARLEGEIEAMNEKKKELEVSLKKLEETVKSMNEEMKELRNKQAEAMASLFD